MVFILIEGAHTIQEGVLIEEGALTEVVRYMIDLMIGNERNSLVGGLS